MKLLNFQLPSESGGGKIVEVINVIAEFVSCNPFELIQNVINKNNQIKAVKEEFDRLEIAGNAA